MERDPGSSTTNPFPSAGVPAPLSVPSADELADLLIANGWGLLDLEWVLISALHGEEE